MSEAAEVTSEVSTETSTPAAAGSTDTSTSHESGEGGAEGAAAAAIPAYAPNFKFKVLDKEHEIPEFLRGAMKDSATEKQLKELHEKAFGLDVVKPKYQETRKQLDEIRTKFETQEKNLELLGGYLQKNDFASFAKALNIPEDLILRYALERVQYRELPLEQRMALDAQQQERERARTLETQSQTFEQKYYAEATANRGLQLDQGLAKPEVRSIADAFDAQVGRSGAFRAEVINRGQLAFHATGADISVDQAMNEVLALAKGLVRPGGTPAAGSPAPATGATPAPAQPPIIPNVTGRSASPAKRVVSSIADLRARAAEL